ncbi:haloacid dehalogenase [Methanococcoides methylutens]|uniref:Haloacid dehalogenase n=1 Tax=Methanococcoides methylutens TaxID=2226 RepID=A0A099T2Y5_METMT|nr:HAD family hydrolase [Methanococcoides methylutens]KGK99550.1 haloacid dehalogenase [Methanococcoides methylutens]
MKRNIKAVLFDMDNTLFDFLEAKLTACKKMVKHLGAGDPEAMLRYFLRGTPGFEDLENIKDYLQDNGLYSEDNYVTCCRIYETIKLEAIVLYPGVKHTLKVLKEERISLALVTDAHSHNATKRLERMQIIEYFDFIVTNDMTGAKKPDHKVFHFALDLLEVKPSQAIFVGDSPHRDIEPARQLGMITAYAAYGDRLHHSNEVQADIILSGITDVLDFVHIN